MPHKPSQSLDSTASSLTSLSSEASVELYENKLRPTIDTISKSDVTLQELVDAAEKIVNERFASDSKSTFKYKKGDDEISVQLDKVMVAMLAGAEECGGESGQRYVASAILACSKEEDVVEALASLSITWLTHLLFICRFQNLIFSLVKTSRGHANQPNKRPSQVATPTVEQTATHLLEGVGNRNNNFPDDVMRRDGYTCVLTGFQDVSHPKPAKGIFKTRLIVAHILRRSIGQFDSDHNSKSVGHLSTQSAFKSALTTFDILVNFTRLPVQELGELQNAIDDPSNGMTIESNAHYAFDSFDWCLKKTEVRFKALNLSSYN
ncbi:hypothetical protein AN958_10100 [Leucoagaricus sp. SymC.cos]|nr:hypothetical protein AN958_10100 [Leucoagaricus sp. SymC.cos]